MTSLRVLSVVAFATQLGWTAHRRREPWSIYWSAEVTRCILVVLFFTLVGTTVDPGSMQFVFPGALVMALLGFTVIGISDIPMDEKWEGTFYRLRLGIVSPALLFAVRGLPLLLDGMIAVLIAAAVGIAVFQIPMSVDAVPGAVLSLMTMAFTTSAAGLAVSALAVGRRADVIASNAFVYVLTVLSGLLVAPTEIPGLQQLSDLLPARHGVEALRAALADEPWAPQLGAELLVGVLWGIAGVVLLNVQVRNAARRGSDDYA